MCRRFLPAVFLFFLIIPSLMGQTHRPQTAWESLLLEDPASVDDPSISYRERLILHVLTPEQAGRYYQGTKTDNLILADGQTLSEYLERRLSPPGSLYSALPTACPLFGAELLDTVAEGEPRSFWARREDLSWQGGSATGCAIPGEAVAVVLQVRTESLRGRVARAKLWAADAPEPAESLVHSDPSLTAGDQTMVIVPLCAPGLCEDGEFRVRTSEAIRVHGEAVGYFRSLVAADQPNTRIRFAGSVDNTWYGGGDPLGVNTGTNNSAFGWKSLKDNVGGSLNTAVGAWSMTENTSGSANTAVGQSALEHNDKGSYNTAVGTGALHTNTSIESAPSSGVWYSGEHNTAVGHNALHLNQKGDGNTAVGKEAGYATTGPGNSIFGWEAGKSNTTGSNNVFIGQRAGRNNATGGENSFVGMSAGHGSESGSGGSYNSFFGSNAGESITDGDENAAFGYWAGHSITTGFGNSAFGGSAGHRVTTGSYNTFLGYEANLPKDSTIEYSTAIGVGSYVSQSHSLVLGSIAGFNGSTVSAKVGIGTPAPAAALHVHRDDGTARLLVEETAASTAVRTLFQLANNGAPRFALKNDTSGVEWSFQQSGPGNFLISKEGTGGPEMQVYQNGRVRMGPGGAINFDLAPNGDLTIAGDLTADGISYPSDRNLKENILTPRPADLLEKLDQLDISYWNYRDQPSVRHVGPMAQDFYRAYEVGKDDRHLNPGDTSGVALAAVQGLYRKFRQEVEERDREIRSLKAELERIKAAVGLEE